MKEKIKVQDVTAVLVCPLQIWLHARARKPPSWPGCLQIWGTHTPALSIGKTSMAETLTYIKSQGCSNRHMPQTACPGTRSCLGRPLGPCSPLALVML